MGKFVQGLVFLVGLAVPMGLGLKADKEPACDRSVCLSALGNETLELSCGGNGETIVEVKFASFGTPTGTCPNENDELFDQSLLNFNETAGCSAEKSKSVIEEKCFGEEECSLKLSELFALADAGLEGCGVASLDQLRYQVHVGCGESFDTFTIILSLLIAVIGLGIGASIELHHFKQVFIHHKRGVLVGFMSQFGFMPLIAFALVKILNFDPLTAVGVIICGCSPGGSVSNLFTYYAKGNVSLSIVMSAASTFAAMFMLPLLIFLYVNLGLDQGDSLDIPYVNIIVALLLVLFPAIAGIFIREKNEKVAYYVEKVGTGLGLIFILAALVIGILDNPDLVDLTAYPNAYIAGALFEPTGCLFGFLMARYVFRLNLHESRAVCLETGVQNFTLAIALISLSYSGCERTRILVFPLVGTLWYLINSIWITAFLRFTAKFDDPNEKDMDEGDYPDQKVQPSSGDGEDTV